MKWGGSSCVPCVPPPRFEGHGVAGPHAGAAPRRRDVVPGRGAHHQQRPGLRPLVPPGCPQPRQAPGVRRGHGGGAGGGHTNTRWPCWGPWGVGGAIGWHPPFSPLSPQRLRGARAALQRHRGPGHGRAAQAAAGEFFFGGGLTGGGAGAGRGLSAPPVCPWAPLCRGCRSHEVELLSVCLSVRPDTPSSVPPPSRGSHTDPTGLGLVPVALRCWVGVPVPPLHAEPPSPCSPATSTTPSSAPTSRSCQ